jgi:hypothetical protein
MTQTKFRAWDKRFLEMTHWDKLRSEPLYILDTDNSKVFMQYTGLLDKNGKEIYVGDLLKISMGGDIQNNPYEVENMWDIRIGMENADPYMRIDQETEIIGNIYQNPDMLKTNQQEDTATQEALDDLQRDHLRNNK